MLATLDVLDRRASPDDRIVHDRTGSHDQWHGNGAGAGGGQRVDEIASTTRATLDEMPQRSARATRASWSAGVAGVWASVLGGGASRATRPTVRAASRYAGGGGRRRPGPLTRSSPPASRAASSFSRLP